MSRNSRYLFCAIALLLSAVFTVSVQAKGKPGGGDPPPNVGVEYTAQFIAMPNLGSNPIVQGLGPQGDVVGGYYDADSGQSRAFLHIYGSDVALDLSDLAGIDRNAGWWIRRATGINSSGDISAYAEFEATPGFYQAVMIELSSTPTHVHVLPDAALSDYSVATDINDVGDIVCKYRKEDGHSGDYIYNFGTYGAGLAIHPPMDLGVSHSVNLWPMLTNPTFDHNTRVIGFEGDEYNSSENIYRWELGVVGRQSIGDFVDGDGNLVHLMARGINADGHLCGYAQITYPSKIKGRTGEGRAFVMGEAIDSLQTPFRSGNGGADLNLAHDFVQSNGMLYHQSEGLLDPLELLVRDDKNFISAGGYQLNLYRISERDMTTTNFPTLVGSVQNSDPNGRILVVLTPQLPSR